MEIITENSEIQEKKNNIKELPFSLKAAALLLIVYGIIGLSYYLFTLLYSIGNNQFLTHLEYKGFNGTYLLIPIFSEVLSHLSIILAGFLTFNGKKLGMYFFYFAFFFSIGFSFIFLSDINYAEIIIGAIILITYLLQKKTLK